MSTRTRHALQALVLAVLLGMFWLACVANLQHHDLIVGAGAVALSVIFSIFIIRTLPLEFRPSLGDLAQVWRLPWYIVEDLVQIVIVLVKDLAGHPAPSLFRAVAWDPVAGDGRETAKRTLAIAYTTVSPNFIVVGIDRERRLMLFHQLKATEVPKMTRNLGAGDGQ